MVEDAGAAQGVEVAIGIEAQFTRAVVPMGKFLARVAERLEMADGFGVLEGGHGAGDPGRDSRGPGRRGGKCQMKRHRLIPVRRWQRR